MARGHTCAGQCARAARRPGDILNDDFQPIRQLSYFHHLYSMRMRKRLHIMLRLLEELNDVGIATLT